MSIGLAETIIGGLIVLFFGDAFDTIVKPWISRLGDDLSALVYVSIGTSIGVLFIGFRQYAKILGAGADAEGSKGRKDYIKLRDSLKEGGTPARLYADWLVKALRVVERYFGDAGFNDRTLFPHAFGLQTPQPLWTAPAFDRCILIGLIYPIGTIFLIWLISGHVGPAEGAMGLPDNLPLPRRTSCLLAYCVATLCYYKFLDTEGWKNYVLWAFLFTLAAISSTASIAVALKNAGAVGGSVAVSSVLVGAVAGDAAVAGIGALVGTIVGILGNNFAGFQFGAAAGGFAVVIYGASTAMIKRTKPIANHYSRNGSLLFLFWMTTIVACLAGAKMLASTKLWPLAGPFLLFFGLISLLNVPFDWLSLGLTRALLWRGLERKKWWPYFYALIDAALAVVVIVVLSFVMIICVQVINLMAFFGGGGDPVLPLVGKSSTNVLPLLNGITLYPTSPEYWWVYMLLLSTMIPSLVNLTIGGLSLTRGIPILSRYLYDHLPAEGAVTSYDRNRIALYLTLQLLGGGVYLGIVSQALLIWGIFGKVMPWLGLDVLNLARQVEAFTNQYVSIFSYAAA